MIITKKAIGRRTFLRGAGAALGLPMLDAMVPAMASAATTKSAPRISFLYVPNGIIMDKWTPKTLGTGFELTPILEPMAAFRDRMVVLSGLAQDMGLAWDGEGGGDHARASAVFLTCAHPKKTEGSGIRAGMSIDQIVANELGKETQVASLELALDFNEVVGTCDLGYSCAYSNTLSWRTPTTPVPMENLPRAVFERLFGDSSSTKAADRLVRIREDRSILDFVNESVSRLIAELGPNDRTKLTEYLDAVRDIERRIQLAEQQSSRELPTVERPAGVPDTFEEHAKLMFDLLVLAYQSDITRVGTFMLGREQNTRVYNELGISDAYHPLTHHQADPQKIEKVLQIDILHTKVVAYFLEKLRSTPDGDGSLLDHSMIVYGSAMSDGNMHVHHDVPALLFAGKDTRIQGGRHLQYPQHTPMANLYVSMLHNLGIHLDSFGDSNGRLEL